jgi:MFS transporter, ACS family, D-galactonate transporter
LRMMPRAAKRVETESAGSQLSMLKLLRVRSAWGTFLGHFCGNYFFYFLLAWLPTYLVSEEKMSIGSMSRLTSAIFLLIASSTLVAGWVSDRLIARGTSATRVRLAVVAGGLAVASSLIAIVFVHGRPGVALSVLAVACVGYGAFSSNHWAVTQTLAGPEMAGRWSSLQNGFANLSGVVAPWVAGWIVQRNGSARMAFVIAGGVALVGAFCWGGLVRQVEPLRWGSLR